MVSAAGLSTAGQVREVLGVQLLLDAVLDDVLHDWCPAGHLIGVLIDALFARNGVLLLPVRLPNEKSSLAHRDAGIDWVTHIGRHVDAQVAQIADHVLLLRPDLGVGEQFRKVFLRDAVLDHHVERNDADLIVIGNALQSKKRLAILGR